MPKPQRRPSSSKRSNTRGTTNRSGKTQYRGGQQQQNISEIHHDELVQLWQQWREAQQDTPQPLDRWLSKYHSTARQRRPSNKITSRSVWLQNAAMMTAARFQQLAAALEAQYRQEHEIDWLDWDQQWQEQQLDQLNPEAMWYWLGLRTQADWLSSYKKSSTELRDTSYRQRLFEALQHQALEQPLTPLWLLWHGIRPQWLPLLEQRAQQSGWNNKQLQNFVKKQTSFPPLWLRAKPDADLEALQLSLSNQGIGAQLKHINGESLLAAYGGKALQSSEEYQAGQVEIQDLASQQIAAACQAAPGMKIWDACAGAGGKTLAMAAQMNGKGSVTATDLKTFKLDELKRRAKRAEIQNIRTFAWDGNAPLRLPAEIKKQQGFDRVLIDAPCTSAGTWRRNPDARWRFNSEDTEQLCQLQQQLLTHAADAVRPGGELVYATCSWQLSENEQQIEQFLQQHTQFELLEQCMVGAPDDDADCMFYARLLKR
ncbi:RsmB/NOP family class I SAM-dependent RNA methyltransferase [Bacterioplanoides sp.]|uniref:RsmB/NOP family class I SAM-dependent RNA methyltransferase n=1 Tax=Bacterioplanoides sp. TaxID=2066072 RepID=UPI003B58FCA7